MIAVIDFHYLQLLHDTLSIGSDLTYLSHEKKTSVKRNQRCRRNLLRPSYKINMNQSEDEANGSL